MTRHRLPHEMDNPVLSLHPERTTIMSTLTDNDRRRIDILFDLFSAHTSLVDPDDRQGARWVVAEAVRLAKRYGFDDPETVADLLAEGIL